MHELTTSHAKRKIRRIVVHCSDSTFGDSELIRKWHLERGFADVGYHFVILNGQRSTQTPYNPGQDGNVELGRPISVHGAHAYGHNRDSVGICLIGRDEFTLRQVMSAKVLIGELQREYQVPIQEVIGHYELTPLKTCPNIAMDGFRDFLAEPWLDPDFTPDPADWPFLQYSSWREAA